MAMMYGEFNLKDHHFTTFWPSGSEEPQVWTIRVTKGLEVVRQETIPMDYRPIFGADVSDVNRLNTRIEEIVKELKLEV